MTSIKQKDIKLAIMQKKLTKYSRHLHFSRRESVINQSGVLQRLVRRSFSLLIFVLSLLLVACATPDDKRIDLKALDTAQVQVSDKTQLMLAAERGDSRLLKLALETGEKINAFTQSASAFSLALKNKHEAISRILLSAGSDWRLGFNSNEPSALMLAADNSFDEILKMLILKGAPLEHKDSEGYTALAKCAKNGHLTTLKILINAGANVNVNPEGRSVLMHVVENNNMLLSQLLIAAGADLNFMDKEGDTALKIARRNGFFDLDLMLVQAGARP